MKRKDIDVLSDPYYILFLSLMGMVIISLDKEKERHPVSFIFDEQGSIGFKAQQIIYILQQTAQLQFTASQLELLAGLPTFANDKKIVALQAADLYAGNVRRFYVNNKVLYAPMQRQLRQLLCIPSFTKSLNARSISFNIARHLLQQYPRMASDDGD